MKIIEIVGVEIKDTSTEVLNSCNLLIKVNCPTEKRNK